MCKVVFRGVGRRKLQQCGVFLLELPAAHSAGWLVENVANRVLSLFLNFPQGGKWSLALP